MEAVTPQDPNPVEHSQDYYLEREKTHTLRSLGALVMGAGVAGNTYYIHEVYEANPKVGIVIAAGAAIAATVEGVRAYISYKAGSRASRPN